MRDNTIPPYVKTYPHVTDYKFPGHLAYLAWSYGIDLLDYDHWKVRNTEALADAFKQHGIDFSWQCKDKNGDLTLPCRPVDLQIGDWVRAGPHVYDFADQCVGVIIATEVWPHERETGRVRYEIMVDHDGFGFIRLIYCACLLEKLDLLDDDEAPGDMMRRQIERGLPGIQLFDSIEGALGAALDDE